MFEKEVIEQVLSDIVRLTESYSLIYKHPSTFEELSDELNVTLRRIWSKLAIKYDKDIFRSYKRSCNNMETYYVVKYYFLIMDPIVEDLYWKHPGIVVPQYKKYKELKDFILSKKNLETFEKFDSSFLKEMAIFNNDISKWDTSSVTNSDLYFKDIPFYKGIRDVTSNEVNKTTPRVERSFEEEKMLREREWMIWKDKYLNEHIKFLEFTWSLDEDSIAHVRIRLELFASGEYYRTGIIDSIGKIHKRVRTRELQALYDKLVSERDQRERKVEGKWKLIQSAKKTLELPTITEIEDVIETPTITTTIEDHTSNVMMNEVFHVRKPMKPLRPEGPGLSSSLGMTNVSEVIHSYTPYSRMMEKSNYDTSAYLSLE